MSLGPATIGLASRTPGDEQAGSIVEAARDDTARRLRAEAQPGV